VETISLSDVDPDPYDDELHTDRRDLTGPLGTGDVALVRYVLAPGERFSGSVHTHMDQEEVFVILEGEATFETPSGTQRVAAGEAVRFGPGEFQSGYNAGDTDCVALAIGAPRDSEDVRVTSIPVLDEDVSCPDCGNDSMRIGEDALVCPSCGGRTRV
jgi:uncharacterized cupin superfamily protein